MKTVSVLHNVFMFLLSLWMTVETLRQAGPSAILPACWGRLCSRTALTALLLQAYINFGWGKHFMPWANMTEKGSTFSPSGHRLATVIWVHYVSKVLRPACS